MMSSLRVSLLPEPQLEFANGSDARVKEGLTLSGPFSLRLGPAHPSTARVGLVGTRDAVQQTREFLDRMTGLVVTGKPPSLLNPDFPGFERVFGTALAVESMWAKEIPEESFQSALDGPAEAAFETCLELWKTAVHDLAERNAPPDVVLCCLPQELLDKCRTIERQTKSGRKRRQRGRRRSVSSYTQPSLFDPAPRDSIEGASTSSDEDLIFRDFRRALKAAAMDAGTPVPIQLVTPSLYEEGRRRQQDPATRSWNLSVGLFYKVGGVPWRLAREVEHTCFVGVTFHHLRTTKRQLVYSSLAQAFSSEGDGFALRGEAVPYDEDTRSVHLDQQQTESLLDQVLAGYRDRTGRDPLRVVLHKSSSFDPAELAGANSALRMIPSWEAITLRTSEFRLIRQGTYPPNRGTQCHLGEASFLFTTGYSPLRETYRGPHIPKPLELVGGSRDEEAIAREILALTKMNWNSADDHGSFPITLAFARKVGAIMTEIPESRTPLPGYRYYM
jgi:hypothetical protein